MFYIDISENEIIQGLIDTDTIIEDKVLRKQDYLEKIEVSIFPGGDTYIRIINYADKDFPEIYGWQKVPIDTFYEIWKDGYNHEVAM